MNSVLLKKWFNLENIFFLALVLMFGWLSLYTSSWPARTRMLPLAVCVAGVIFTCIQLLINTRKLTRGQFYKEEKKAQNKYDSKKIIWGFLILAGAIFLAYLIGLIIALGIMGIGLGFLYGERRWIVLLGTGVGSSLLTWLVFSVFLQVRMYF